MSIPPRDPSLTLKDDTRGMRGDAWDAGDAFENFLERKFSSSQRTLSRDFLENPFSQIKREYFFSDVKTGRTAAAPPTTVFILWVNCCFIFTE